MKKLSLILIGILVFKTLLVAQPQLSFRFSNPLYISGNPGLFQFDIEIQANSTGSFLRDLQIYFDYNPSAFGSDVFANGKVSINSLALMANHYQIVNQADNTSSKFSIIIEAIEEMNHPGSSQYFSEAPTTFTGLVQLQMIISDTTQTAGISFDQALMNSGQYMQSTTSTSPIAYQNTNNYENEMENISITGQNIILETGWTGISSYLIPFNSDVEGLFNPIIDGLIILQNFSGMFIPDQNINTLGNWVPTSGYMIKLTDNCQLRIMGARIDDKSMNLKTGWNLLPVLSSCNVNTAELFSNASSNVIIVKDVAGTGVYWPAHGINTLPMLKPGKSYFVKMSANEQIEFPDCDSER